MCCFDIHTKCIMHLYSTDPFVGSKEEIQTKKKLVQIKFVILENSTGKKILLMPAFRTYTGITVGEFMERSTTALLTNPSIRVFCIEEELIASFRIINSEA